MPLASWVHGITGGGGGDGGDAVGGVVVVVVVVGACTPSVTVFVLLCSVGVKDDGGLPGMPET